MKGQIGKPDGKFLKLCEIEPRLMTLYKFASMIGRRHGKDFCANFVWYEFLKPELCLLVGDGRTPNVTPKESPECATAMENLLSLRGTFNESVCDTAPSRTVTVYNRASSEQGAFLRSALAYDIAYNTIYNALPDCRGCNGICS